MCTRLIVLLLGFLFAGRLTAADVIIDLVKDGNKVDDYDAEVERVEREVREGKNRVAVRIDPGNGKPVRIYWADGYLGKGGNTLVLEAGGELKGKALRIPIFASFPATNESYREGINSVNRTASGQVVTGEAAVPVLEIHDELGVLEHILVVDLVPIRKDAKNRQITLRHFLEGGVTYPVNMLPKEQEAQNRAMEEAFYRFVRQTARFIQIGDMGEGTSVVWTGKEWKLIDAFSNHIHYQPETAPTGKYKEYVFSGLLNVGALRGKRAIEAVRIADEERRKLSPADTTPPPIIPGAPCDALEAVAVH